MGAMAGSELKLLSIDPQYSRQIYCSSTCCMLSLYALVLIIVPQYIMVLVT